MSADSALSQMNIRLERNLKTAGDKALMEQGITPTELVRALWQKIARSPADLQQVEAVIGSSHAAAAPVAVESSEKLAAIRRGRLLFEEGLLSLGLSTEAAPPAEGAIEDDVYAEAMIERMRERGTW